MPALLAAIVTGWLGIGFTFHATPTERWIYVRELAPGSPAAAAGLAPQDVITRIDGRPIAFRNDAEALQFFRGVAVGRVLTLTVVHRQQTRVVRVRAAPPPAAAAERWRRNEQLATPRPR